jgi:hypothetical protein
MRKTRLPEDALCDAVSEMTRGLIDADLGGGVIKKRIALPGQGKRGGARTIVATKKIEGHWFFLYGFRKNERASIDRDELKMLQEVARELLGLDDRQLATALSAGEIMELCDGNKPT